MLMLASWVLDTDDRVLRALRRARLRVGVRRGHLRTLAESA
jgi:hypothetical protein